MTAKSFEEFTELVEKSVKESATVMVEIIDKNGLPALILPLVAKATEDLIKQSIDALEKEKEARDG